jgi:hypothetical protein
MPALANVTVSLSRTPWLRARKEATLHELVQKAVELRSSNRQLPP